MFGLFGPARECTHPGAVNGKSRVTSQLLVVEPAEPRFQRLHAAVVVQRQGECVEEAGDGVSLARSVCVDERILGSTGGKGPRHRASVELGDQVGLARLELVTQQLAKQMVVAEPFAATVERNDEAVCPRK